MDESLEHFCAMYLAWDAKESKFLLIRDRGTALVHGPHRVNRRVNDVLVKRRACKGWETEGDL